MRKLTYRRREVQALMGMAVRDGASEEDRQRARRAVLIYCAERKAGICRLRARAARLLRPASHSIADLAGGGA